MASKWYHFLAVLLSIITIASAKKCRDRCHPYLETAQADCTQNAFVLEKCETIRCRFPPRSGNKGMGWSCSTKADPPSPSPEPACPSRCFATFATANALCECQAPRCKLRRCRSEDLGEGLGYQCAEVSSTSTPDPTPETTMETGGLDFTMDTFFTGTLTGSTADVPSTIEGDPRTFSTSYNLTSNDGGIVSLNGVADSVFNVECFTNGTIRVILTPDMTSSSVAEMYPIGAVIIVDRAIFGECLVEEPIPLADSEEDVDVRAETDRSAEFRDTYLLIESVSGSPNDALISGSVTEFIGLFAEGEISVVANDPNLVRKETTEIATSSKMEVFSITGQVFTLGPLELTARGSLTDNGGFRLLTARWDRSGIDLEMQLAFELIAQLELQAAFKVGLSTRPREVFTLLSVPLYGLPNIPIIDEFIGNSSMSELKLGVFFEVPLIVQLTAEIEKDLGTQATASYTTGRKEITYFVTGPYNNIDAGIRLDRDDPSGPDFMFTPMVNGDDPLKISFTVFTGIRPQVILYLPFFNARVSVDIGVSTRAQFASLPMAFPPNESGGLGFCDTCHLLKLNADGVIQNAGAFANLRISIPVAFGISVTLIRRIFSAPLPGNPMLAIPLANACFLREFGENTEVCGSDCCNTEEMMCMTSGTPPMMTCGESPSPTPSPIPSPTPPPGRPASCYTDPHLRTFDGLSYDCQASGEFTMVQSGAASLEIQARFTGSAARGTVTTGIAVSSLGIPTIQVSMAINNSTSSTSLAACPVIMYVDGVLRPVTSGSGQDSLATVSVTSNSISIVLNNGVSVSFRARLSGSFGCYFESLTILLPEAIIQAGPIAGLLGSPNGNPMDDWMTPTGELVPVPTSRMDLIFEVAYDYCTTNWCVTDEANSLFTYEDGTLFSDFNSCDTPYRIPLDFSAASPALQELCGEDNACLVDGLVGNIDDAMNALNVQAEVDAGSAAAQRFRFDPPIIVVDSDVNVLITVDLTRVPASDGTVLESFNLYRVDSETNEIISGIMVELFDNGLAVNSDEAAGDRIYTNVLAIRSETAGERFSFRAIPVFEGEEDEDSALVQNALTAIRSYSMASAIGGGGGGGGETLSVSTGSISGLELIVRYSWPIDQTDLDTSTEFSDENVGFSCSGTDPQQYVSFSGDDTSAGGTETVTVLLDQARVEGDWTDFTSVVCRAGWFGSTDRGPASLRMVLQDSASGLEIPDTGLSLVITPGVQGGCADMLVATLEVRVDAAGVKLDLLPGESQVTSTRIKNDSIFK